MEQKTESNVAVDNWFKASGYRHRIILGSIISTLVVFGTLGWLVDYFIHSRPAGFVVGVIVSFIVSQYIIYDKMRQYTKKLLDK
jgi:F0F1-type ATP synthase assembly protein I